MDFLEVVVPAIALRREKCPHCGKVTDLGLHCVRNTMSGYDEGKVLVCAECGGYAKDFLFGDRIADVVPFVCVLLMTWGLVLGFAEIMRSGGGLALNEWPPLEVALPMGAILLLTAVATAWSVRGFIHLVRAPTVVALTKRFRMIMK